MAKKVLVSGGAGFHGSWVVQELLDLNHDVVVLDNFSWGNRNNLDEYAGSKNLSVVEGDIRDKAALGRVMPGVDTVYHLAAEPLTVGLDDPFLMESVNSLGTLQMLEAAHRHNVSRFNYISSSEVYGTAQYAPMDEGHPCEPRTVYSASKYAGEAYVKGFMHCYGTQATIIRPFNAYGPRHRTDGYSAVIFRFIDKLMHNQPPVIYDDGEQTRDFNYVEDNAHWIVQAGESDKTLNTTINIGSGVETSINDLARLLGRILEKDVAPAYEPSRPGDLRRLCCGSQKARQLLGYKPAHDLEQGLRKTVAWYLKHHA